MDTYGKFGDVEREAGLWPVLCGEAMAIVLVLSATGC